MTADLAADTALALADTDRRAPLGYYTPTAADLGGVSELTLDAMRGWAHQRTLDYGTEAWSDTDRTGGIEWLEAWAATNPRPAATFMDAPKAQEEPQADPQVARRPRPPLWPEGEEPVADAWGTATSGDERLALVAEADTIAWCNAALRMPVRGTPGAGKNALQTEVVERLRRVRADLVGLADLVPLLRSGVGRDQVLRDLDTLDARLRPVVTPGVRRRARQIRARLEAAETIAASTDGPELPDLLGPSPSRAQPATTSAPSVIDLGELADALGVPRETATHSGFLLDVVRMQTQGVADLKAEVARLLVESEREARLAISHRDLAEALGVDERVTPTATFLLQRATDVAANASSLAQKLADAEEESADLSAVIEEAEGIIPDPVREVTQGRGIIAWVTSLVSLCERERTQAVADQAERAAEDLANEKSENQRLRGVIEEAEALIPEGAQLQTNGSGLLAWLRRFVELADQDHRTVETLRDELKRKEGIHADLVSELSREITALRERVAQADEKRLYAVQDAFNLANEIAALRAASPASAARIENGDTLDLQSVTGRFWRETTTGAEFVEVRTLGEVWSRTAGVAEWVANDNSGTARAADDLRAVARARRFVELAVGDGQ